MKISTTDNLSTSKQPSIITQDYRQKISKSNTILLDACIVISMFLQDDQYSKAMFVFHDISIKSKKICINQIQLYEIRYILKMKKVENVDLILDSFMTKCSVDEYANTKQDYIVASDYKANGGLSPYDGLPLAQITKDSSTIFLTFDKEFQQYQDRLNLIVF